MTIDTERQPTTARAVAQPAIDLKQELAAAAAGVSLRLVTKKYGPVTAVENVSFDIPAGTTVACWVRVAAAKQRFYGWWLDMKRLPVAIF